MEDEDGLPVSPLERKPARVRVDGLRCTKRATHRHTQSHARQTIAYWLIANEGVGCMHKCFLFNGRRALALWCPSLAINDGHTYQHSCAHANLQSCECVCKIILLHASSSDKGAHISHPRTHIHPRVKHHHTHMNTSSTVLLNVQQDGNRAACTAEVARVLRRRPRSAQGGLGQAVCTSDRAHRRTVDGRSVSGHCSRCGAGGGSCRGFAVLAASMLQCVPIMVMMMILQRVVVVAVCCH